MGRQKKLTPSGKYKIRSHKEKSLDKPYPLQLEYIWNRESVRQDTGIRVCEKDWNQNANNGIGELRSSYGPEYRRENQRLLNNISKIDVALREYNDAHPNQLTIDIVRKIIKGEDVSRKDQGKDFVDYVLERVESKYKTQKIGISVRQNAKSGMKIFKEFLVSKNKGTYKTDGIYLGELTPQLVEEYITWRKDVKQNKDETINHSLTPIIQACEFAADFGLIDKTVYTYIKDMRIKIKVKIDEDEDEDVKSLTEEQMNQLINFYEKDTEQRRKEFVEMFLFAFHTCGLRIIDIMTLQWKHIDWNKREINKIQVKTKNRNIIPLTTPAIQILKKWKEMERSKKYVFDLIPDDLNINDDNILYKARTNATKCVNQSLKVIGEKLGFNIQLTAHKARHTWACWALNKGMDMTVVSRLLGHSSSDITERIYAQYSKSKLDEEVAKLNFNFLPDNL